MNNEKPTDEQIARDAAISMCPISKPDGLREKWLDEAESIILSAIHKANERVIENVLQLVMDGYCEKHSGENTPPFDEFQKTIKDKCFLCCIQEISQLRAENEQLEK